MWRAAEQSFGLGCCACRLPPKALDQSCGFANVRQPLVIWLTVPLAFIGVTSLLLLAHQPFGLLVATVLTMIVVPVVYAIFLKAKENGRAAQGRRA